MRHFSLATLYSSFQRTITKPRNERRHFRRVTMGPAFLGLLLISFSSCDTEQFPGTKQASTVDMRKNTGEISAYDGQSSDSKFQQLAIIPAQASLAVGDTLQLNFSAINTAGQTITTFEVKQFTTSDQKILEVNEKGLITAKGEGQATVTLEANGAKSTSSFTVTKQLNETCNTFAAFNDQINPILQNSCISCHGKNGSIAARSAVSFSGPDPDANEIRASWNASKSRLDIKDPSKSLLVGKAMGLQVHGGGSVLKEGSDQANHLKQWVTAEVACQVSRNIVTLELNPSRMTVKKGSKVTFKAVQKTGSGDIQDVSGKATWSAKKDGSELSPDLGSLTVSDEGALVSIISAPGVWTITASKENLSATAEITVLPPDDTPNTPIAASCKQSAPYVHQLDQIFQTRCASCHGDPGINAARLGFALTAPTGDTVSGQYLEANELAVTSKIAGSDLATVKLLNKALGKLGHGGGAALKAEDPDFMTLSEWTAKRLACSSTEVASSSPSPTPSTSTPPSPPTSTPPITTSSNSCPSFVDFRKQVAPILHTNCGSCHHVGGFAAGAFRIVQNDAACEASYENWQETLARIDATSFAKSLILAKPSGSVAHGGGAVIPADGSLYQSLAMWVKQDISCRASMPPNSNLTVTALCKRQALKISISPPTPVLQVGETLPFSVLATFDDMSTGLPQNTVTWISSDSTTVRIDQSGVAVGLKAGSAKITAKTDNLLAEVVVTVKPARTIGSITIVPLAQQVGAGETATFTIYNIYTNGEKEQRTTGIIWSTSDSSIAVAQSSGIIQSKTMGSTKINVKVSDCVTCSASADLKVTAAVPVALAIDPNPPLVTVGLPTRFKLLQVYSDGAKLVISDKATWTSGDLSILEIDTLGNALGKVAGAVQLRVTYGAFNLTTSVLLINANGCNSLDGFKTQVDPMLQSTCLNCHKPDGVGAGAMALRGPSASPSSEDVLHNWGEFKSRVDGVEPLKTSLMVKALNPNHPGSSLLKPDSTPYKTLLQWTNIETACLASNQPSNLSRSSGKVLYQRLATLFPTAVSTGIDTKPLFMEEFDPLKSTGAFKIVSQPEKSMSPLVQVLWRGKINLFCKQYILGNDTDQLFKWTPDLLLANESIPVDAATKLALAAARRAWLYPYKPDRPEVLALADLYKSVLALGGTLPDKTARQAVCVAALTAPQFLLGNAGQDDVVRRVALEVGGTSPLMADFAQFNAAPNKVEAMRLYTRKLQQSKETSASYLGRISDWHQEWLGLREFYDGNYMSREPSTNGIKMATGVGGAAFKTLTMAVSGFPRAIEKTRESLNNSAFDFSESCAPGVEQVFDPRTQAVIWEHWNPSSNAWEEVGRWAKQAGNWTALNGQITNADGTKLTTSLKDIINVTVKKNTANVSLNYYTSGALANTPVDGFSMNDNPGGRQRRIRRISPTGEQNGYSTINLWWSNEPVKVCNTVSRFLATCAYRPAKPNGTTIPNLDVTGTNTTWNAFDLKQPRMGTGGRGSRDDFAHPKILEAFSCGIPNTDMLALANSPQYFENTAFPKGYSAETGAIDPASLNTIAFNIYDLASYRANKPSGSRFSLTDAVASGNQKSSFSEDNAMGRLIEDVSQEPVNLIKQIVSSDLDYRLLLTAPFTYGRTELDLYYRSQGYYLPAYPPGFMASELGRPGALRKIEYGLFPALPTGWLQSSAGGLGSSQSEITLATGISGHKPRVMSGILTQTAFLAPVRNNGKTRSVSARIHERLLCGLPNEFVNLLDTNAMQLHEMYVSAKGANNQLHLDRSKGCYSCHVILDPVAATFSKNFMTNPNLPGNTELRLAQIWNLRDGGMYGLRGGGDPASGVVFGQKVEGVVGLANVLAQSKEFSSCVVKTAFKNIFGRTPVGTDIPYIDEVATQFRTKLDYNYNALIEELAASAQFQQEN